MAKKKRKRRPVAPPVHSAPDVIHRPTGPPTTESPPARPYAPEPPAAAAESPTRPPAGAPGRARNGRRRRPTGRKRRGRTRTYLTLAAIAAVIVGLIVFNQVRSRSQAQAFEQAASAAGCGELQETDASGGGDHLAEGATVRYDSSPPTHGAHDPGALPAGIYEDPFSNRRDTGATIYKAVHSLEHGYVIVWHDDLSRDEQNALERRYRNERKVIVVPYPQLRGGTKMAVTAWARIIRCDEPSIAVVDGMIDRFREARSAPEPNAR